jgi:hypothetical protein
MMLEDTAIVVPEKVNSYNIMTGTSTTADHQYQMFLMLKKKKKKIQLRQRKTLNHLLPKKRSNSSNSSADLFFCTSIIDYIYSGGNYSVGSWWRARA